MVHVDVHPVTTEEVSKNVTVYPYRGKRKDEPATEKHWGIAVYLHGVKITEGWFGKYTPDRMIDGIEAEYREAYNVMMAEKFKEWLGL